MDKISTNLSSKNYCPYCDSFNLKRAHRGFIKKTLLKLPVQFECQGCGRIVSGKQINKNDFKDVPQFIN